MATVEYLNYEVVQRQDWDLYDKTNFDRAAEMDLDADDYGKLDVDQGESILEAADAAGHEWLSSCRAAACAKCAAVLIEGEIEMDMQHVFGNREIEENDFRLTCVGSPATDYVKIVCNASGATPYW